MKRILSATGTPARAIADVPAVVQACHVCREWKTPGPRNITTFRLITEFNVEVQFDLLFYHSLLEPKRGLITICHLICACIRWSATGLTTKEEVELCKCISRIWISWAGPMGTLVTDVESGLSGRCAMDWALANGVNIKFKAPRQKAWIVERHNEILRRGLHGTESQLKKESLTASFEMVLAQVTFMHNSLTVINSSTPYQALLGRQPAMLPPLEGGTTGQVESLARPETNARNEARVREMAAINIIESIAKDRLDRAHKSKSRPAIELSGLKPKDLVEIWFEPSHKDLPGWRGPAEILSVNADDGNFSVRLQGRTLIRQNSEV